MKTSPLLTDEQLQRYSRQTILQEVGIAGQRRLLDGRVLIIGAGGLGSPAALYLAAAGVGHLGIVDGDRVDLSNLQRQILHFTHDVGRPKTQSARRTLEDVNPDVEVIPHQTVLSSENALDILRGYDVVVNGCDNFPTRYLVNDACVMLKKPLVDASILRWEGQATTYLPGRGCYRCLFPTPPPPGSVPTCADAGVVGAMAGFFGTLQALEALKILLGLGETLANRLLLFDALSTEVRIVRWQRDPTCPVCGDEPSITALIDYEEFCGVPYAQGRDSPHPGAASRSAQDRLGAPGGAVDVTPAEAWEHLRRGDALFLDVREKAEREIVRIDPSVWIPQGELPSRLQELPSDRAIIVYCAGGHRSARSADVLRAAGFQQVFNLQGGLTAWLNQQLPVGEPEPAR